MKGIGGYFGLELQHGEEFHKHAIRLNTGRNAFEYLLRSKGYKKVFLPYFTCDVLLEPIKRLEIKYEFYHIDDSFRPVFDFESLNTQEVFVYTNYFGVCDNQVDSVYSECQNLIIDNSQAFFSMPLARVDTFYSPRKFFGVPDGAYLYTDTILVGYELKQDFSYHRCEHLLGRIDLGPEDFYSVFKKYDRSLSDQSIKKTSPLTERLLKSIDYRNIGRIRRKNFYLLHNNLRYSNKLNINVDKQAVPMIYPYLIDNGDVLKKRLISNKIYVPTYWPNIFDWAVKGSFELNLAENLIALPIDQRYGNAEMDYIIGLINNNGE